MLRSCAALALLLSSAQLPAEESLRVFNWEGYVPAPVLEGFTRETGIRVHLTTYDSVDVLERALKAGEAIDVIGPSHFQLAQLIGSRALLRLDPQRLPSLREVDPGLMTAPAGLQPQGTYSIPYLWGSVGLVVNPALAEAAYGGPLPHSWSLLFDPDRRKCLSSCGVGLLDAPQEVFSLLLNYQGKNLARLGSRQISRAGQMLVEMSPTLSSLNNDRYIEALAAGHLCVAMAWNGHAMGAATKQPDLRFLIPQEGGLLFIDTLAIPMKARHTDWAYRFIESLLRPSNAVQASRATGFYSNLREDSDQLQSLVKDHPLQVTSQEERRRMYFLEPLTDMQRVEVNSQWDRFRTTFAKPTH